MTRIAIIDKDRCKPHKCGHLCAKVCPINKTGADCITIPEKAHIDEVLCTGCGICVKRCPFNAINIINLPEELTSKPIHRYGKNEFCLYSLPTPILGKVVGIVGKNGIGKSTAFKIIAGLLPPNFGEEELMKKKGNHEFDYSQLIQHFKGTESQGFFENLRDKKVTVSYKPQAVDFIPQQFDGTIQDLLNNIGTDEKRLEVIEKLDLTKIIDRDIKSISGGELQRVAIAACLLKEATLYIFDEPTSFLDIKQRLKISKIIHDLADENTSVLVIEHDLIILDSMTDLIHLMYGEEGCYGIVSQPKSTKVGINLFLGGVLKDENVRFRNYQIKFMAKPPVQDHRGNKLCSWTDMKLAFSDFSLDINSSEINGEDIVGVLGANGIGKTTFARILAGVTKADSGSVDENKKISYKPQYINTESETTVFELLIKGVEKYENMLMVPLGIDKLYEKRLSVLSGGELQRVAIVECLIKDADIYLLDEPSAYLDVEQRILLSKILADFIEYKGKTAIVIDHDLLFIDYISRKIMVFDGEPSVHGILKGVFPMEEGMNHFLENVDMTFRRDSETHRPRANKPESQMERKQKTEGRLYYG